MNPFVKGTVLGLGFGLGLAVALLVVFGTFFFVFLPFYEFGDSPHTIVGTDVLEIRDHRLEIFHGKPAIYGTLANSSNKELFGVIVEGSIFNQDGYFITKSSEYFAMIAPEDTVGLVISFYDWKDDLDESNMEYKLRIKQGSEHRF